MRSATPDTTNSAVRTAEAFAPGHIIGNLTLLTERLNPVLRNGSFATKRPEITRSLLALNAYFQTLQWQGSEAVWDERTIRKRAEELFAMALRAWPHPVDTLQSGSGSRHSLKTRSRFFDRRAFWSGDCVVYDAIAANDMMQLKYCK